MIRQPVVYPIKRTPQLYNGDTDKMKNIRQRRYWKDVLRNMRTELNDECPWLVVVNINRSTPPPRAWLRMWTLLLIALLCLGPTILLALIAGRRMSISN